MLHSIWFQRLESLNEKRSGVVQMVKLAEKERDGLEVPVVYILVHRPLLYSAYWLRISLKQDVKNEAEAYMLKELSLLIWQEKATSLAHDDTSTKIVELQEKVVGLEENLKSER